MAPSRHTNHRTPYTLVALAALAAGAAFLPLIYLVVRASQAGADVWDLLLRPRTLTVLMNTTWLALTVTASAIVIGVPLAYLTTRTNLRGRRIWFMLTVVPLVIPSYVGAFAMVTAFGPRGLLQQWLHPIFGIERLPSIYGFTGSWLVLTLFTYPLVLLGVRAALLRMDPSIEEAARTLGKGPLATFFTVTLPLLRPAILAGSTLVALYALSDFGVVSTLRFDSFTQAIYVQYTGSIDRTYSAALGLMLILLTGALVGLGSYIRGNARLDKVGSGAQRPMAMVNLGPWQWPAQIFCGTIVLLALVAPVGVILYWLGLGIKVGEPLRLLWGPAINSLLVSAAGAFLSVVAALPVAILSVRYPGRLSSLLEKAAHVGYALPGIVVAISLVFFGIRYVPFLYQSHTMLVIAYMILFLPQAIGSIGASLRQINPNLEEAARNLGRKPWEVLQQVTVPLALPGILSGAALVFLTSMKELPATLLLSPIGFRTLATSIWSSMDDGRYVRAAAPMLLLILISSLSLYFVLKPLRDERAGS